MFRRKTEHCVLTDEDELFWSYAKAIVSYYRNGTRAVPPTGKTLTK